MRKRIRSKSTVELTDSQQAALDHAMTRQLVDQKTSVEHDVLHFMSHRDCALRHEVKQRRNYSKPIAEENKHLAKQIFEKTDLDLITIGKMPRVFMVKLLVLLVEMKSADGFLSLGIRIGMYQPFLRAFVITSVMSWIRLSLVVLLFSLIVRLSFVRFVSV